MLEVTQGFSLPAWSNTPAYNTGYLVIILHRYNCNQLVKVIVIYNTW